MNVAVQFFYDKEEKPAQVMLRLRECFRAMSGLPLKDDSEPVSSLEESAIFVLCYAAHYGSATPRLARTERWLKDLGEYRSTPQGLLPYYVMRTHHRIQTETAQEIAELKVLWQHYVMLAETPPDEVAEYTTEDSSRTMDILGRVIKYERA